MNGLFPQNTAFRIICVMLLVGVLAVATFDAAASDANPAGTVALSKDERIRLSEKIMGWPPEESLPVPPQGWYNPPLGDDTSVFRDEYGVPHVFASSIEAAFRAQGYVAMEDRCREILRRVFSRRGRLAELEGESAVGHDTDVRKHGYTEDEIRAMLTAQPEDFQRSIEAYTQGANIYLSRCAPSATPLSVTDIAALSIGEMASSGNVFGGQQLSIFKLLSVLKFMKGEAFTRAMLNDSLPYDVPNSPTIDHSVGVARLAHNIRDVAVDNAEAMASIVENEKAFSAFTRARGVQSKWGSQAWTVAPWRSATGHALLWASPMMGFSVPASSTQIHLMAPGLNVTGISLTGTPGVVIGHNERVAWGVTSGLVVQTDIFVAELNPENHHQYRYKGQWKDMEVIRQNLLVRQDDGSLEKRPIEVCRTVQGPVIHWVDYNHRAYIRCAASDRHELESYAQFLVANRIRDVYEGGEAVRRISTSHNFITADVDGNIGYFLAGRLPKRHPDHDYRLPVPASGEYDWQGVEVAADVVSNINPPEGWFGNFNNKPSTKIPGWWPELMWGQPIHDILKANNPIDWDTFVGINRANGEHHLAAPFLQPHLLDVLRKYMSGDPQLELFYRLLEAWPGKDVPDDPVALIFNEWLLDILVELFRPDFGFMVERSMSRENLQLFGALTFRVLEPQRAGFPLEGEYLHGRDPDELSLRVLKNVLNRLTAKHGPDMEHWPYDPPKLDTDELGPFPARGCGTYWIVSEMTQPIRSFDMLYPGQSALHHSPHFKSQLPLFLNWQLKPMRNMPEDFPPRH